MQIVNLAERFSCITEHWRPKIVAELNGQVVRLVKVQGEFVWHRHADADELFYVVRGDLRIDLRDGPVTLRAGEMLVVPRGVEHRPVAENECEMLLFEPAEVRNTGDVEHPTLTAPRDARL
ncbi:MAG TPA: cupin domain-containing protein [Gemmatimonadales bacterium]|nr:cupin domain-containing protein [Gemmatimonadales bacterium]